MPRKRKSDDIHVRILDTATGQIAEASAPDVSAALIKAQKRLSTPSIFASAKAKPKRRDDSTAPGK